MVSLKTIDTLATFFVILGAFNWGLVGVFDYNVITALLGEGTLTKVVYVLVGFFAIYMGFNTYGRAGK